MGRGKGRDDVSPIPFPPSHHPSRFSPFSRETTGDESELAVLCDWYSGSAAKSHSPSTQYRQLGRLQSAVGSETVREKSGWQGKLSTQKGHKCNEARIPTNAFYLKRKALLPGKQRHDKEIMVTCDQVINLEFDCQVRMYF